MRKSSLHRIQGFGTDCLVSGGVWTLLRITSAPNFCNISFACSLNTSQGKRTSLTNYLRETWIQPKSVGVLPLSLVRPTLNLKDCRYLKTLLDLFFLHLMRNFLLGKILEQKHLPVLDPLWYQFPFSFKARQKKKPLFSPSGQPLSHLSEKPLCRILKNVFFFFFSPTSSFDDGLKHEFHLLSGTTVLRLPTETSPVLGQDFFYVEVGVNVQHYTPHICSRCLKQESKSIVSPLMALKGVMGLS